MTCELNLDALNFADIVRRGETVCWGQVGAEPLTLTQALLAQRAAIGDFSAFIGIGWSATPDVPFCDHVHFMSYCAIGTNGRLAAAGKLNILPCHYSELWKFLEQRIDVLLLQVAPADEEGTYSLSLACDYLLPLIDTARIVVAEVNDQAPLTFCERPIRAHEIDIIVRSSRPIPEAKSPVFGPAETAIAKRVAELIEDGAVLQIGIGTVPECVVRALADHHDLGVHSGMISDGIADLMEDGVVTNARKNIDQGVSVTGFLAGSKRLTKFAHRNPKVLLRSTAYTHSQSVIQKLDRFTAINTAIEVDLTGQVNSETVRGRYVGAVGGAVDFLRGARASRGGLPITALPATAAGPEGRASRIVCKLNGPVSISRADVGIIVTEHGIADLRGLSLAQRMERMVAIANPAFQENLQRGAARYAAADS
jgi:acyl-CoA hydrolase